MIVLFGCLVCRNAWQILGCVEERENIAALLGNVDGCGCITPLCSGRLVRMSGGPSGFSITELPIRSFYRAIHGFGTGEGDPAAASEFARLLKTKKIADMTITSVGQPERVIVHQLVLEDGTRMHFDSSSRGACCYYIERPGKSCVEVAEDELATVEAPVSGTGSNREEAGRSDTRTEGSAGLSPDTRFELNSIAQSAGTAPMWAMREDSDVPKDRGG